MNTTFEKGLKEILRTALLVVLMGLAAWLGGYMTARFYTKRMVQDASMLVELIKNG